MALTSSSWITDVVFILAVVLAGLYVYFTNQFKHWKKRGVHYVEPTMFVGNLGSVFLRKEGVMDMFRRIYVEAVDHKVVGIFLLNKPIMLIRDLDVARSVLAKDAHVFLNRYFMPPEKLDPLFAKGLVAAKGKKWRHIRLKITPTFTSGNMKKMLKLVEECSNQLLNRIDQEVSEGKPVMVKDLMSRYTMNSIASCAFGLNANALEDANCEFIIAMKKMFETNGWGVLFFALLLFVPWLQKIFTEKTFDRGVNDFVRKTFWDVVDYRKTKGIVRNDLVDLLRQLHEKGEVRAEDAKDLEEIKQDSKYITAEYSKTDDSDVTLDDDDIVAQAFIFMIAGYETSSSVISFSLYELALNPAVQDILRREIEDVLKKHGHLVTYDAIAEMRYLDMVVSESMRKYAPLPFLERQCLSDYKIEGTDITVEKGTVVFIPIHGIHYDPDIYPDPEKFDPERFSAENKGKMPHFAYLPFGEGPRKCVGMRFGLMQVKTGLVHILKTFQVRPCEDTPEAPLKMKPFSGFLLPEKELVVAFTKLK